MFRKILIANRGEIAVRIIRACRDMGIISVAVYSEADSDALHAQIADESICIGRAPARESYLNMEAVLSAAVASKADAIHPGFGFLSENARFAELVEKCGMTFIGPKAETIRKLGDKAEAKRTMKAVGVPVIPGSDGPLTSLDEAKALVDIIGYPIMLKAAAGGGGRGIRLVKREEDLESAWNSARTEAKAAFSDDTLYLEKFIESPRHIEFQVFADNFGNTVHLFERDCSVQRRHQKLLEESPSPFLTPELRDAMGKAAVSAALSAGYRNAGTVEFLMDADRNFYFCEMNTRIQVEHPVTEWVTGVDLVALQIRVAAGEKLPFTQDDLRQTGHAMECRINAEDPENGFAPRPGQILALHIPGGIGVRVDSAVYQGYNVPPYYDSMVAKLIVSAATRGEAIARMKRALVEFIFDGLTTNVDYQLRILNEPDFMEGNYTVDFLGQHGLL